MLSNEGVSNLKLLKDMLLRTWRNNVTILSETETQIPVDAFELLIVFYGHHKVLLEYEMGMFAFKIWTGKKFEYLDKFTNEKIVYGFDSGQYWPLFCIVNVYSYQIYQTSFSSPFAYPI